MLEDRTASLACLDEQVSESGEAKDFREIIASCPELPEIVKRAEFTCQEERTIDRALLTRLTDESSLEEQNTESRERLGKRRKALGPYLGSELACIFIRIPGGHYTIEIDSLVGCVVYWEWQTT